MLHLCVMIKLNLKFVLGACSPLFESIIGDLPQGESSVIYLRGVLEEEMKSILQFMYLGEATFYHHRVSDFMNVAKSLEIKELYRNEECDDSIPNSYHGQENKEHIQSVDVNLEPNENLSKVLMEVKESDDILPYSVNEDGRYQCEKCDKQFVVNGNFVNHYESVHEGIVYTCTICKQAFSQKGNLKRHIESIHGDSDNKCDLCDYTTTQKSRLKTHKKYHCDNMKHKCDVSF